jgi:hypothetical protein
MRELSDREALYCKLRSNDPEITSIDADYLGLEWGPPLGQALTNNTQVSSINMCMALLLLPDEIDTSGTRLAPFLEYLRNSPSLRHVTLRTFGAQASLINLVIEAIAQSRRISSLHLDYVETAMERVPHFLQTTTSLKTLQIGKRFMQPLRRAQVYVDAFHANQTLEELELEDEQSVDLILPRIGSHPRLRSLRLIAAESRSRCAGLSDFLCTTTVLEDLSLEGYEFYEEEMTRLLAALVSNHSVTRLCLCRYRLSGAASTLFSHFVRCECNRGSNKIREIHLEPYAYDCCHMNLPMLLPSSVDVLSIMESYQYGFSPMESFFDKLMKAPSIGTCKYPSLRISFCTKSGVDAMIRYLPTATTLRELVIFGDGVSFLRTAAFRKALRENGSIISFTVEPSKGTLVDDTVLLNLRAYGDRNQMVQELLKPIDSQSSSSLSSLTLFPSLFCVAQQAPRIAPNVILMGLLAAGCDSVGFSARCAFRMKRQRDAS